ASRIGGVGAAVAQGSWRRWNRREAEPLKTIIIEAALVEQSPPGMGGLCNTEKEDKRSAMLW
ncbi:MAG: hypothetical protein WBD56_14050, partial [Anaerolineales bacterium]